MPSPNSFPSLRPPALWLLVLLAVGCWPERGRPQGAPYTESQLKVLFVQNFAKYTTWPKETLADTNASLTLGVVGGDLSDESLNLIRGKPIKSRTLVITRFADTADAVARAQELASCQILFVGASQKSGLQDLFKALEHTSVLTIGEVEGFLDEGGVINFVVVKNKLNFEIHQGAAQKANLRMDTQLLKLAKAVKG